MSSSKVVSLFVLFLFSHFSVVADEIKAVTIHGKIESEQRPKEITLNIVKNGEAVLHSTVKVADDGSFGFLFKPPYSGFYTIGKRGSAARLFLTPGRVIKLTINDDGYEVNADDRENTALARWAKTLWPLKKCNQLRGIFTYKEIFPLLPVLEKSAAETITNLNGLDPKFQSLFQKLVPAEFEYEVLHFLYMPRSAHPKKADYPEIYQQIAKTPRFQDDSTMQFDFGKSFVRIYVMFQTLNQSEALKGIENPSAEMCLKYVSNQTVRGWYLASNVLTRSRVYDAIYIAKLEKYRKYLVTDEQRKLVSDFVLTINKFGTGEPAIPITGTTPGGKKISLSEFKGKVVLVDVWATWCGPCKAQIPHLQKLEKEFHGSDIVFMSYSIDALKDLEKWKKFIADQKLGGVQLIGEAAFKSTICKNYGIKSIPRFMLFDKEGKIVTIDAPRPSDPKLKALLKKHLK